MWALAVALIASGCSDPSDAVKAQVSAFGDAVVYRDLPALYQLHVDSQGQGVMCEPRFEALFTKARQQRTPATCGEAALVAKMPSEDRAKLGDEVLLLSEILHFQCQNPDAATCQDFAHDVFMRRAASSRLLTRKVTGISTTRVRMASALEASAYVDVAYADATEPERLTLYLRKTPKGWRFTTYPW